MGYKLLLLTLTIGIQINATTFAMYTYDSNGERYRNFLSATADKPVLVSADSPNNHVWTFVDLGQGTVALKNNATGKFLSADQHNNEMRMQPQIGPWEKFLLVPVQGRYAIQAIGSNNRFVTDNLRTDAGNKNNATAWDLQD